MLLIIIKIMTLCHWLPLTIGLHHYQCEYKSPGLNACLVTTDQCNTRLNVQCTDRHLDIRTVDSDCDHLNDTHLPPLDHAWTQCTPGQHGHQLDDTPSMTDIKLSDNYISSFPDDYFCDQPIDRLIIFGNSLSDTTKLGFSPVENCDKPCLTNVQTLQAEQNNFKVVFNDSFCGLDTLIKLHLRYSEINELESDAFVHLKSLQILDLKNNNISKLPIGVFRHQQNTLLQLDMSNNQLDGQSVSELKDLQRLESLNLEGNRIDVLPNGVFTEMKLLRHLKIGNNLLKQLHNELKFLKNLETLDIKSTDISVIQLDFKNHLKLRNINIQNNPIDSIDIRLSAKFLNITHINFSNISLSNIPQFISKARKIKWVYLSKNNIDRIDVGAFDVGENIDLIDLSYNQLTDITDIFSNCSAKQLYLNHNQIKTFEFNDFSPQLTLLSMTHNHIHTINCPFDVSTVDSRWTLKTLNLSNNLFSELKDLSLPTSVANFYVKNNNISFISYSDYYIELSKSKQISLKQMHLENNDFKVVCPKFILAKIQPLEYYFDGNPLLCSCENQWLSLTSNVQNANLMKSIIADGHKLTCQYEFQRLGNQPKLIQNLNDHDLYCSFNNECACDINRVACNVKCPQQCQCHKPTHSNHIYIDCSSKSVTLPLTTATKFNKARELYVYLDNNSIYKINSWSLNGLNNTIELYLNWTGLSEIADGSFDHLTVLNVLNLEHNNLRHISDDMFKNLNSLTQLILSHNQIQTIEPNAFPPQLQTLKLDNNQLVEFRVWQLEDLSSLNVLNVRGNKWSCDCNHTDMFRKWLHKYSNVAVDTKEIDCVQDSGAEQSLIDFESQYCINSTVSTDVNVFGDDDLWQWFFKYF